jgi:di/tricarboxylate transporter
MCEAVISSSSPIIGKTIRNADFRATYGAAVVAVHRGGSRVETKVGDIRLQPGDTLLLQTQQHFARAHRNNPAFYLVSDVDLWRPLRRDRAWAAVSLFLTLILFMTTGLVPTLVAAALIASAFFTVLVTASAGQRPSIWINTGFSFQIPRSKSCDGVVALMAPPPECLPAAPFASRRCRY